jgi:hypothetical protein
MVGVLFAIHGIFTSPWDLLHDGDPRAALATWAIAPSLLAALALLVGDAELSSQRTLTRPDAPWLAPSAALLPLIALAALATTAEHAQRLPEDWIAQLSPIALATGLGLATCALFWQGTVQYQLAKNWPRAARIFIATALGSLIWVPFWIGTSTWSIDGFALWLSLSTILLINALLHELGLSTRVIALLSIVMGAAAVLIHHAAFL